ncbi:alpha/beta hydrolase [Rhodococcus sp. SC4]|uniref:alpha/beta fold hydrolase n=1 Tax=Rhodococcus sp. LB1 TaxID=1807499 RepID=UPI00076A6604|nr:alpha/beta hydrolase [Rhodococcus sp. LB1]KXF50244.1 alpha/beta hydrolase [Rhodococcus sp. SC4]KXX54506.1 alpha/beta hydrolase [Rhodococcus sp. LB1]
MSADNVRRPRAVLQTALADLASLRATSRWVDTGTLRLHVLDYGGNKPPMVMLPGITSPAITLDFVASELLDLVRPVVIDMRGRGLSDSAESYSLKDYVDDTRAVIDSLHLESPVLFGHSMGARVAGLAASLDAEKLAGTILVDPPMTSGPGRGPYPVTLHDFEDQLVAARRGLDPADMARTWPTWPPRELGLRARWLSSCADEAIARTHEGFESDDFFDFWPGVPEPTVLIYGADSPMASGQSIEEAKLSNPKARFVKVPGAGHMVLWDAPERALSALRSVLTDWDTK